MPGTKEMWAPDISFWNGRYHLYYAVSTFGSNRLAIGLFTNATLDPKAAGYVWNDEGMVSMSKPNDDFNAIDPNHVIDRASPLAGAWQFLDRHQIVRDRPRHRQA